MPQSSKLTLVHDEADLSSRIQAEFIEMPGLKLTLEQASRLFGTDRERCGQALNRWFRAASFTIGTGHSFVAVPGDPSSDPSPRRVVWARLAPER